MNPLTSGHPSLLEKLIMVAVSILAIRNGDNASAFKWDSAPVFLVSRSNVKYHVRLRDLAATAIFIASNTQKSRGALQNQLHCLQSPSNWLWRSAVQSTPLPVPR